MQYVCRHFRQEMLHKSMILYPLHIFRCKHVAINIINIKYIIASLTQGVGCRGPEPLTVERLQSVYSADERRVIHDAVVNSAPFCHDLTDLDLLR